ncbi:MAG: Ig-like domain-containing protein [Clostridiales bacterium]|nr:Ig-like domain-containing protein [Clostridiales bacterium]
MKKLKRFFGLLTTIALAFVLAIGVVACDVTPGPGPDIPDPIVVEITGGQDTIKKGETMTLSATVTGTDNQAVTWTVSDPTTLRVDDNGVVSVLTEPEILNKLVTITATSVENSGAKGTKTVTVLAPKRDGQVGYLTTAMLAEISGENITVTGTVTDKYVDSHTSSNSRTRVYDISVEMEEGAWSGSWSSAGTEKLVDTYYKGTKNDVKYTITDLDGYVIETLSDGHSIEKEIINKYNEVTRKMQTDYRSKPLAWEAQHYWNHLGGFNNLINETKMTYDPADPSHYEYNVNTNNSEEFFLVAYLAQSLTPMLDPSTEWFRTVVFELDEAHEHIVAIDAQCNPSYSGASYDQSGNITGYDAMSVSEIHIEFSKIGSTAIAAKTPYAAPENADKLTTALNNLKNATSYRFTATENAIYEGGYDDSDYSDYSLARAYNAPRAAATFTFDDEISNYNSATGTVGLVGYVSEDAIVLKRTGKYSYTMDDKIYHVEYSGYRQFDGYFEMFEPYVVTSNADGESTVTEKGLKGIKRLNGSMQERVLPKFDFSANLFEFSGSSTQGGKTQYTFKLQESDVTRDIAMQVSMHSYSDSSYADSSHPLTIVVDSDGNVVSVTFPYNITTAYGTIKTTFDNIGSTAIAEERLTTNYKERGSITTWDKFEMKYYVDEEGKNLRDPKTGYVYYPDALTAIKSMYGSSYNKVPAPTLFTNIFDDYMSGPFCEEYDIDLGNGQTKYLRYMAVTCQAMEYDENRQLPDELFDKYLEKMDAEMTKAGLSKLSIKITDYNRLIVYGNTQITIRVENIYTSYFYFDVYLTNDYAARYN